MLLFLLLFSFNLQAQPLDPLFEKLYQNLMPSDLRQVYPLQTEKSFKTHLLDSYQTFPDIDKIVLNNLIQIKDKNLFVGTMTYVTVFKKKYQYDVLFDGTKYIFNVRIFIKNSTPEELISFKDIVFKASEIWNRYRPLFNFNYEFKFEITEDQNLAHYKVELKDDIRGPYDMYWDRQWNEKTLAHESGHMLGLGDEYQTATSKIDCLPQSIMCLSTNGYPMLHHYYFILRRLVKNEP